MASPFPGMNPYLEQSSVWEDFHQSLITEIRESIAAQVRPAFLVKIEERVFIHEPSSEERGRLLGKPDVAIIGSRHPSFALAETVPDRLAAIIATIPDVDIEKHSFIEIRDRQNRELVTMIEVLSPSNKRHGPDREQYLMKRSVLLCSPVSIVEIDLLRGGPRLPMDGVPACDYCAMVSRRSLRPNIEVWPIQLRDPLPILPIPLKGEVPDAKLDLQALLNRVYDAAGYEDYIYESPPEPPLPESDAAWSQAILANAARAAMKIENRSS
jgi:hypothetical protein